VEHQVVPQKGAGLENLILQQVMPDGTVNQTKIGCISIGGSNLQIMNWTPKVLNVMPIEHLVS